MSAGPARRPWRTAAAAAAARGRAAALAALLLCASLRLFRRGGEAPPPFPAGRDAHRPSDGVLLGRRGAPLQEVRAAFRERVLPWVPLAEVSPARVEAVLRSEDKRFFRHPGVDGIALLSAAAGALGGGRARGASTITMQLANLLGTGAKGGEARRATGSGARGRAVAQGRQARAALLLERSWTKEQILEAYLNRAPFRGELRGVAAAARGIFGKEPGGLDRAESAVLACLLRSPNASPEVVARRAERLCAALGWDAAPAAAAAASSGCLRAPYPLRPRQALAPHAARLLAPGPGERVVSTIDAEIQEFAAEALARHVAALSGQNVADAAALVVENGTGGILAYVGSAGPASESPQVDGVRARRQAGSTLKPFLYGAAFERRLMTPASLLSDSPLDVPTERGLYAPQNYDREFRGMVPARVALASSLNVPAVRTILLLGPDEMARRLAGFGFELPGDGEDYGASLALGSADVTLFELVSAYRALADDGRWRPLTLRPAGAAARPGEPRRAGARRALSREAAFLVSDILADRGARGETFGLHNPLATPFWSAVKTGTSKDMRDNWCVGYSDRYTVGVWAGNFSGEPMWDVSGVSGPRPRGRRSCSGCTPAARPRARAAAGRREAPRRLPRRPRRGRDEWCLAGTEPPAAVIAAAVPPSGGIRYPVDGTIVALDPDIPEGRQLVFFEAEGREAGRSWELDGVPLGPADAPYPWKPAPGSHRLALVDRGGARVDAVSFQVRGNPLP
jgi:penicillin-binding protein 1C